MNPFNHKDMDDWMLFQKVILDVMLNKIKSRTKIIYDSVVVWPYDYVITYYNKYIR